MITASEARILSDKKQSIVRDSLPFKSIMGYLDEEIRKAIDDGNQEIIVRTGSLSIYANETLPDGFNKKAVDAAAFWWKYVSSELALNGYKIYDTMISGSYKISW